MTPPGAPSAFFPAQQTFAAGTNPFSLALADVNGDGKPDIVVANINDNKASVLRNTTAPGSAASFAAPQSFATGARPRSVTVADVNGDGQPDIVVANFNDNSVTVLRSTPATIPGNLATGTITDTGPPPVTAQFSTAAETIDETAGTFRLTVTLSAAAGAATTIPFTLGGTAVAGTDYSGVTASPLLIPAGQTSATIAGTLLDDNGLAEADSTLTLTLGPPTGAALGAITTNTLTLHEDNDAPPPGPAATVTSLLLPADPGVPGQLVVYTVT